MIVCCSFFVLKLFPEGSLLFGYAGGQFFVGSFFLGSLSIKGEIMKSFLPLNIRIDNKKILFVGGGKIALHKIKTVLQYTRNISIISPVIHDELHQMGFEEICKEYETSDLEGFFLVYACTNNIEVNSRIKNDAAVCGIMVNVVDNREL